MDFNKPMKEIFTELFSGGVIFQEVPEGIQKATDFLYSVSIFDLNKPEVIQKFYKTVYDYLPKIAGKENRAFQENYFNNFTPIWIYILGALENTVLTEVFWLRILDPIIEWEKNNSPLRIHKGSPYYYLGVSLLHFNFVEKGYLYFHKSYVEDKITHLENDPAATNLPNSPSYLLLTTDDTNPNQFYLGWVQEQTKFIQLLIDDFNTLYSKSFDHEQLRIKFLGKTELIEETYLFSYTSARIKQIFSSIFIWDKNLFESKNALSLQILLSLCFDLTKIIEKLILVKEVEEKGAIPRKEEYFVFRLSYLTSKLNAADYTIKQRHIDEFNRKKNLDLSGTITQLLDGGLLLIDKTPNEYEKTFLLSNTLRNHFAHKTEPFNSLGDRHQEIIKRLYHLLFLVLDTLY
jgi:hypothetical protein